MRPAHSSWHARLELGFRDSGTRTVLAHRRHIGPLMVQRPFYPEGSICHVYLLHPPGGLVGGDSLTVDVDVAGGARALVTTPAAGKFYRSAQRTARQVQRCRVAANLDAPFACPDDCLFFESRSITDAGWQRFDEPD